MAEYCYSISAHAHISGECKAGGATAYHGYFDGVELFRGRFIYGIFLGMAFFYRHISGDLSFEVCGETFEVTYRHRFLVHLVVDA